MSFTQYYVDCLSRASYLVGDETTGAAVLVDPRRDVAGYRCEPETEGALHIPLAELPTRLDEVPETDRKVRLARTNVRLARAVRDLTSTLLEV